MSNISDKFPYLNGVRCTKYPRGYVGGEDQHTYFCDECLAKTHIPALKMRVGRLKTTHVCCAVTGCRKKATVRVILRRGMSPLEMFNILAANE